MTAVVGIIYYSGRNSDYAGKILIGKKKAGSKKFLSGKWHVPGGTRKRGEDPKEALVREMKEETGLEIVVGDYVGHFSVCHGHNVRWYECFTDSYDARPGSDLEELKWVPRRAVSYEVSEEAVSLWPKEIVDYFKD